MINVGIVGVGHLGEIHLKLILSSKYFNLVGFYETDKKRSSRTATYSLRTNILELPPIQLPTIGIIPLHKSTISSLPK